MGIKHTPGPWQADNEGSFVSVDMDASKMICDIRGWGWLQKLGHDKAVRTQMANAKLIAAAPDLLSALMEASGHVDSHFYPELKDMIEDAIKKATE